MYRLCHVHETSPGTHTLFPTYTCPVYCWRSVQLLDFGLCSNLIHASQPIRTTFTGQWFASGFLQTPPHDDALAIGCTLPTAGRVRDFHPLERALAGHTTIPAVSTQPTAGIFIYSYSFIFIRLITFSLVNSSLSFSSRALVMVYTRDVYMGMVIFCSALARFWVFLILLARR